MGHFEALISRGNVSMETIDGQPTDIGPVRLAELASNLNGIYFQVVPLSDDDGWVDYKCDKQGGACGTGTFTLDDFDESHVFGATFMDCGGQSFDEPPTEADLAQFVASATTAVVPFTPAPPIVEPEPAPKRRRIGRKTSEACLPQNIFGDEDIKAAFTSFLNKRCRVNCWCRCTYRARGFHR